MPLLMQDQALDADLAVSSERLFHELNVRSRRKRERLGVLAINRTVQTANQVL